MRQISDTYLCFVHIPKTAGQAVVNAFGLSHKTSDHSINSQNDSFMMTPDFIRFCVVRDPISRFISAYRYSVYMISKQPNNSVRQFIIKHSLAHDINDFIEKVAVDKFNLLNNLHFIPQITYINKTRPQIILRQENLTNDINIVAALAPEHYRGLSKINVSDDRSEIQNINYNLTNKNLKIIQNTYSADYQVLGYPLTC